MRRIQQKRLKKKKWGSLKNKTLRCSEGQMKEREGRQREQLIVLYSTHRSRKMMT